MAVINRLGTADSQLGHLYLGGAPAVGPQFLTDNPTTSENTTRILSALRTSTDHPTLSDIATEVAFSGDVTFENIGIIEAASKIGIFIRTSTDSSTISEIVISVVTAPRATSETPTLSENVQRVGTFTRLSTDAPTINQSIDWVAIFSRTVTDSATFSEVATGSKTFIVVTTDNPTLAETLASVKVFGRLQTDTPTLSETLTAQKILSKSISQSLTITHSNLVATPIQSVEQGLVLSQTVSAVKDLARSLSSSLTFSQSADYFQFIPTDASNTLTITQSVDAVQTTGVGNVLTITQDLVFQYDPHYDQGSQLVVPTQSVTVFAEFNRTLTQSLTLIQSAIYQKIISLSVTSTLSVSQTILGGVVRIAFNTLDDLDQTVLQQTYRNKSLSQSIAITHSVGLQMILNRSMISTLVFKEEHPIPDGAGSIIQIPNLIFTKGGSSFNECCPVASATTVLQSATRTIVLPNPEYNDAENLIAAVSIKRTITGMTYSYVKKSTNRKLKYKFLINQRKAYELRRFLLDFLGNRITMTNWEGEMWSGFILSDPSEITSSSRGGVCTGDLYEYNFEYQGVRVN